jgi:hypothetical protein
MDWKADWRDIGGAEVIIGARREPIMSATLTSEADYLRLAQFLQSQSGLSVSHESLSRCAVSRAYFAAFCHFIPFRQ